MSEALKERHMASRDLLTDSPSSTILTNLYTWGLNISGNRQGAGGVGGLLSTTVSTASSYFPLADANGNITEYMRYRATLIS